MRIDRLLPNTQVREWVGPNRMILTPSRLDSGWSYFSDLKDISGFSQTGTAFTSDGSKTNWSNGSPSYLAAPLTINQTNGSHYVCADIMINSWANPDSHVGVGFDEFPHVNGHYFVQARLSGGSQTISILRDNVAWQQNTAFTWTTGTYYRIGQRWNVSAGTVLSYVNGTNYGSYNAGVMATTGLKPTIHAYGTSASYSVKNIYYWSGAVSDNPPMF